MSFLYFLSLQVNFLHWQEGEPNNLNNAESCAEYNSRDESGYWNDLHCESYNDWLCQIRAGTVEKMCSECLSFVSPEEKLFLTGLATCMLKLQDLYNDPVGES